MKPKIFLQVLLLTTCLTLSIAAYAATPIDVFGNVDTNADLLKKFSLIQSLPLHQTFPKKIQLPQDLSDPKNTVNTLQLVEGHLDTYGNSYTRYDQYYRGIPVFGMQIIYCVSSSRKATVTGFLIDGIDQDIPDINNSIPIAQIKKIALGKNSEPAHLNIEKMIYFDGTNSDKAVLAYLVSYPIQTHHGLSLLYSIIDANNGTKLKEWDGLTVGNRS